MMMERNRTTRPPTGRAASPGARAGYPAMLLVAACVAIAVLPRPAAAIQILEAADPGIGRA
ncbi:MAG: hypothetical protein OXF33_15425 [Rhodospirillales bacterium]|nr:hypothetical protein [Rhodospirillales bacterium]